MGKGAGLVLKTLALRATWFAQKSLAGAEERDKEQQKTITSTKTYSVFQDSPCAPKPITSTKILNVHQSSYCPTCLPKPTMSNKVHCVYQKPSCLPKPITSTNIHHVHQPRWTLRSVNSPPIKEWEEDSISLGMLRRFCESMLQLPFACFGNSAKNKKPILLTRKLCWGMYLIQVSE